MSENTINDGGSAFPLSVSASSIEVTSSADFEDGCGKEVRIK